jgi:CDP-ribitol ribitolphosphotransferase
LLVTNRHRQLSDNLRAIEQALAADSTFEVRQCLLNTRPRPRLVRLVEEWRLIATMAWTEYTVIDDYLSAVYSIRLRPGAHLVQVWHGAGAFKRVGFSRRRRTGGPAPTSLAHRNYTAVAVSGTTVRENYAEAFGVSLDRVYATGTPRTDRFFDRDQQAQLRAELYAKLPFLVDRRVIIFAPTFRGKGKASAHYPADFLDLAALGASLSPDDVVLIKMHPFVKQTPTIPAQYSTQIFDVSEIPELTDLLLVCDLLITDYSSVIFDYALLERPILFYVPDLAAYKSGRGLYYDFDDYAYGPVVADFASLVAALDSVEVDQAKVRQFRERFLDRCDGQATRRFIETILTPGSPSIQQESGVAT